MAAHFSLLLVLGVVISAIALAIAGRFIEAAALTAATALYVGWQAKYGPRCF